MDVTPVITGRTGIAVLVTELAAALGERGHDVRRFAVGRAQQPVPPGVRHFKVPARFVHRSWAAGGPPRAESLVGKDVDVVHATGLLPPSSRKPIVATVMDLAPLDFPELHTPRLVQQIGALVRHLDKAAVVAVISEATGESLVRTGFDRDRIVVTYPGLPGLGTPAPARQVDGPYLLAVGEHMPRKNLAMLIEAFAAADIPAGVRLVHAGPPTHHTPELEALVATRGLEARVEFRGFVDRPTLAALFRDATALCFPSASEGFGFPVLEAMALGIPVLASDIPPHREIAQGAARLVDPTDRHAWIEAITTLLDDDRARTELAAKGPSAAAPFTWERCAIATEAAYRRALGH